MSKNPELEEAIKKMRSEGLSNDSIKIEVLKSGHSEEDFKEVLSDIKNKLVKYFFVGLVTYIILIICSYFFFSNLLKSPTCSGAALGCIPIFIMLPISIVALILSSIIYSLFIFVTKDLLKVWMYFIISPIISIFLSPIIIFFSLFVISLFN